jgi:hypothetical protein
MKKILPLILCCLIFCACRKDSPPKPEPEKEHHITGASGRLLILNEGNFMMGNASLSMYRASDGSIHEDVYFEANQHHLGDVGQSMNLVGNQLWMVVNNSGCIAIVDTATFVEKQRINGLQSPRYMLQVGNKLWVSDLYGRKISLIDPQSSSITGHIPFRGWSEEMIAGKKGIWVCAPEQTYIYLISPSLNIITDSIEVGRNCSWIEEEPDGSIIGISAGKAPGKPCFFRIDKEGVLTEKFELPFAPEVVHDLETIAGRRFFLAPEGLFEIRGHEVNLVLSASGRNFYSMTYLEKWGLLAITDAGDYVSKGKVLLLDPNTGEPELRHSLNAGIIPGRMMVLEN